MRSAFILMPALCLLMFSTSRSIEAETLVFFGTYTEGKSTSEGIYVSTLNESSGELSEPRLAATIANPSFVAIHPTRPLLYAVSEVSGGDAETIGVVAYSINDDGTLTKLNERSTLGAAACHLAVDPTGRCVGVANYGGGSSATYSIEDDGSLGELGSFHQHTGGSGANPRRQNEPHAHSFNFNQDGTQAFVADLGKDQILIFDVNSEAGTMEPATPAFLQMPLGGGPRHFCFHPSFRHAFSNLEMTSNVAKLAYDAQAGELKIEETLRTLPESVEQTGNSTAECLVHPNGRNVYVSNRGHNSIANFAFDSDANEWKWIGNTSTQGEIPRGFGIAPGGRHLVVGNQRSGNIVTLEIDENTGELSPTGHGIQLDSAVNARFLKR